jgi:hypothetical protein
MKRKTIKKVISKEINKWLASISDKTVYDLVKDDIIVTGGCIVSMFLGEDIKDFDIYLRTKESALALSNYYVNKFNRDNNAGAIVVDCEVDCENEPSEYGNYGIKKKDIKEKRIKIYIKSKGVLAEGNNSLADPIEDCFDVLEENKEKEKYRPVFLSSNAITLSDKIQIIIRFYGEPEEIHSNYDFIHCTNYWVSDKDELTTSVESLESILSKTLFYQGSKYPLCSIIRTRKFITRGWSISAGEYLKMVFQLNELDLTDIDTLEDQLIGVDSAYFGMIIDALREHVGRNPDFKVSSSYVVALVDKIFN